MSDLAERADQHSRKRARVFMVMPAIFLTQQAAFFTLGPGERLVDRVQAGAWVLLVVAMTLALVTGGAWLKPANLRAMMEDEVTRANRGSALTWGFVAAMMVGTILFVYEMLTPGSIATVLTIHLIVTGALAVGFIRFSMLERRSLG